jgi:hypothetical protein
LLPPNKGSITVKDYQASIEKLRKDAAEAAMIRDLATDPTKRDMYDRLHKHLNRLADEVEQAVKSTAEKWANSPGLKPPT